MTPRSVDDLFALPDAPISQLDDVEVALVAQIVDTALFKCYLATKPSMLGPLCRLENWCQVDEVETLLMEAKVRGLKNLRWHLRLSRPSAEIPRAARPLPRQGKTRPCTAPAENVSFARPPDSTEADARHLA